jgi:hypothetical protein
MTYPAFLQDASRPALFLFSWRQVLVHHFPTPPRSRNKTVDDLGLAAAPAPSLRISVHGRLEAPKMFLPDAFFSSLPDSMPMVTDQFRSLRDALHKPH